MHDSALRTQVGVQHLDHLNLSVADLAETARWYAQVFDFEEVERGIDDDGQPWAILQSGQALLCAYQRPGASFVDRFARKARGEHGIAHFALTLSDRVEFERRVKTLGLRFSYGDGPIRYPASTSFYLVDPTGYPIEVVFWDEGRPRFR